MTKFLASGVSKFAVIGFIALAILQSACYAQNAGGVNASIPAQPAATGNASASAPVPAEVLKELEAMKARIAELEAQVKSLKSQDAANAAPANVEWCCCVTSD